MSEMIERVARAIHEAGERVIQETFPGRLRQTSWEEAQSDPRSAGLSFAQARAAIDAVYEPTEAMVKSAHDEMDRRNTIAASSIWRIMIDEALKENV